MRSVKAWLIAALSLILVGAMIFGGALAVLRWDLSGFWKNSFEKGEYAFAEAVESVSIRAKDAKVEIVSVTSEVVTVKAHEYKNAKHTVTLTDGVLLIEIDDQRAWYEHIFSFGSPTVTVELPEGVYGDLRVEAKTGDVTVKRGLTFGDASVSVTTGDVDFFASATGEVSLRASTGDIEVENATLGSLSVSTSTGDVELENTLLSGELRVEAGTGDVHFDSFDASEIFVKTSTGDVKGLLLSEKVFIVNARTGRKDVPKTTSGGRCEIETGTGDVKITLK